MPDSKQPQAERRLQLPFSKSSLFSGLAVAAMVMGAHLLMRTPYNRTPRADAWANISFTPIGLAPANHGAWDLAGAWSMTSPDPRLGGLSALAVDGDGLVALSDSGVAIRFPRPEGAQREALFRDLPAGPGDPRRKSRRDSEALARLSDGDWLVAFENRNEIWRYDANFRSGRRAFVVGGQQWRVNRGIEAMAVDRDGALLMIPEARGTLITVSDVEEDYPLASDGWIVSDAARLPDGRLFVLLRTIGLGGFRNALGELRRTKGGWRVAGRVNLPIGGLDNAEGLAAERMPDGGTRIWIVTDNDAVGYRRTLLVALDLKAQPRDR